MSRAVGAASPCISVSDESPANAPVGMVVNSFAWMVLRVFSIHSRGSVVSETNSVFISPAVAPATPKQYGRLLIAAMFCPLLFAAQQDPNSPFLFTAHSFCSVAFSVARSSAAVHVRTAARSRKEMVWRESFISCVWEEGERGRNCLSEKKERKKERKREKKDVMEASLAQSRNGIGREASIGSCWRLRSLSLSLSLSASCLALRHARSSPRSHCPRGSLAPLC